MKHRAPLIGVGICLVLALGFYFLQWKPLSEEQAALDAERVTLEQRAQQLRIEVAQLEEIEANQVEIRAALAQLEEYIPAGPAQPAAVRALQESADDAGIEIISVAFGAPTPIEDAPPTGEPDTVLAAVPLLLQLEGGYFRSVDFLRRLETDVTRASLFTNLAISEGDDGFPQLTTSLTGQMFAVVAAPPPAPEDAPVDGAAPEAPAEEAPTQDAGTAPADGSGDAVAARSED